MSVTARQVRLPFVRTGLGPRESLVLAGVAGVAFVVQHLRGRKERRLPKSSVTSASKTIQAAVSDDDLNDWGLSATPIQPREADGDQVILLEEDLPLSPKDLWRLIYDPSFVHRFYEKRRNREYKVGKWGKTGTELVRRAHYITPVKKNAFGPREAFTEEEHRCRQRGQGGFQVHVCAYTRKVPYGSTFHVELHWTATRISQSKTRLQVVGGVVFEKRILVGGVVKKATLEGLRETYADYREHLWGAIKGGDTPREPSKPPLAARTASAATKAAAEDLINNGIFISWGQIISFIALVSLCYMLVRLSMTSNSRLLSFDKWPMRDGPFSQPSEL